MVRVEAVTRHHGAGRGTIKALDGVSLVLGEGGFTSIMGPSGCGKSTLLNLIGCLDTPTSGRVFLRGRDIAKMSDRERSQARLRDIGIIFQSFHLLPRLTVLRNTAWRLKKMGASSQQARLAAETGLRRVGLDSDAWDRLPAELSGGEQQKVAIARALVTKPQLLLADEPTGNLDSMGGQVVLDLLKELNVVDGISILLVTHDHYAGSYGHRTIQMRDGRIVSDSTPPAQAPADVIPLRPQD